MINLVEQSEQDWKIARTKEQKAEVLLRYNCSHFMQLPYIRYKCSQSQKILAASGYEHPFCKEGKAREARLISADKNRPSLLKETEQALRGCNTHREAAERLGVHETTIQNRVAKWQLDEFKLIRSNIEEELHTLFGGITTRKELEGSLEIDLYFPDKQVGIEVNGRYFHSDAKVPKDYHQVKSRKAKERGIRLIHIYDFEYQKDKEKILAFLQDALRLEVKTIGARKTECRTISTLQAREFLDVYHLKGFRASQIYLGLFYSDELVQVMTFSYNNRYNSYEIIRNATKHSLVISGGSSKLIATFKESTQVTSLISYCDLNKFDGRGYEAMGFEQVKITSPDMLWLMPDSSVVNRNPARHQEMKNKAIGRVWGAGSILYKKEWQ